MSFWRKERDKEPEKKGASQAEHCGFCTAPILKDDKHSGMFYTVSDLGEDGKIHTECWVAYQDKVAVKCLHCQGPVANLPGRFGGKYFVSDDPKGQVHSECWEAWKAATSASVAKPAAEKCDHCFQAIEVLEGRFCGRFFELDGGIKLHAECRDAYHAANTAKCLHCSAPVAPEAGKFSGEFYEVGGEGEGEDEGGGKKEGEKEDGGGDEEEEGGGEEGRGGDKKGSARTGGRVHAECFAAYSLATAPKCVQCGEGVAKHGAFSGEWCQFDVGRTHKECLEAYLEALADRCAHCNKGVLKTHEFSGSYYPVTVTTAAEEGSGASGGKVHVECWEEYQAESTAS